MVEVGRYETAVIGTDPSGLSVEVHLNSEDFKTGVHIIESALPDFKGPARIGNNPSRFRANWLPMDLLFTKEGFGDVRARVYSDEIGQIIRITPDFPPLPKPEPEPEPEKPEYPKTISRASYNFTANNPFEEEQLNDFLGIKPAGDDLDTWLFQKNEAELLQWQTYWDKIFSAFNRVDLVTFARGKYQEYLQKLKVPEEIPSEKLWWAKLIELSKISPFSFLLTNETLYKKGYELLTGKEMSEAEYDIKKAELLDWIVPMNALTKLFLGKNLQGEAEEFGSATDWTDMILSVAMIIPVGKVAGTGAKLAISKISTKEALGITAKFGQKGTINRLLRTVEAKPETSARFLSKFPDAVRNAVIAGLGKTSYGREVIFTLGKTGYFNYTRPIWGKAMRLAFKFGLISAGVFMPIFAVMEIPNYFNMRVFARKAIAQQEGEYAPDMNFQLNEFEQSLEKITWELKENIETKQYDTARENLDALESVVNNYENYINEKKGILFTEDYDLSVELIEFYRRLITDRRELVGEKPTEERPPEEPSFLEEWEETKKVMEEWHEEQLKKKEDYYLEVFRKLEEQKDLDLIEKEEYYDNLYKEQKQREDEEREADKLYYEEIIEKNRIAEIEKREDAADYYERIYAEELEREKEKREQDKLYYERIYAEQEARKQETGYVPTTWSQTPYVREKTFAPLYPTLEPAKYELLSPEFIPFAEYETPEVPEKRELMINIETTSLMPFEGRIYSIALQDLSRPELAPMVLTSNNEIELIQQFLDLFEQGNYDKLVGYNTSFDYRFIWTKMMQYRMKSPQFYWVDLVDVMQIMKQVKEQFVFTMNKVGKLDEWGKMILGKGKYSSQETMLKRYISGDFAFVEAFQLRQLELTNGLYQLSRFSASQSTPEPIQSNPEQVLTPQQEFIPETQPLEKMKKCPNCLQENPMTATECSICGANI